MFPRMDVADVPNFEENERKSGVPGIVDHSLMVLIMLAIDRGGLGRRGFRSNAMNGTTSRAIDHFDPPKYKS